MSPEQVFWAGQEVYIKDIFLPVIIGVLVFVPAGAAIFAFGFLRHWRLWKLGQPDDRSGDFWRRLGTTLKIAIANYRIIRRRELYPGVMHALIFGGVAVLLLGKIVRLFSYVTGVANPPQSVYLYASFASEAGGVLLIVGGVMALVRRYIVRPPRLDNKPEDGLVYTWVALVVLTGFIVKGYRIAAGDVSPGDWMSWSPVGYLISPLFLTYVEGARNEIFVWHRVLFHTVPAAVLLGYIWLNRSRLQHILLSPLNVFYRSLRPRGELPAIDFEKTELFGAAKIEDFTWKHLMDLDACTRCGRCQDACPAYFSGKALNPKQVVLDLKDHLYETYPVPLLRKPSETRRDMVKEVVTDEVLWDCTTCRACMEACPVYIEHVPKIVEMRRNLAMEQSRFPEDVQNTLKSLGTRGHPFRGTSATRTTWLEGLDVPLAGGADGFEILYWVGCAAALEERNMKTARAVARILRAAGVNFAVLGEEEGCCGDPARRLGDEYLFQTICQGNIEVFKAHDVKKIVTACPHCFNSLKNEYPQFGGSYEVVHHSQFIAGLLREGRLAPGAAQGARVAYHDSCYLGRYNDIYDEPRQIVRAVSPPCVVEFERRGLNSFCCGGGGGHMWMEEDPDKRVNLRRVDEALRANADVVATACPYCLTMFEDGVKAREMDEAVRVRDIAELVAEGLAENPKL